MISPLTLYYSLCFFPSPFHSAPDYKFFDVNFANSVGRRVAIFDSGRDSTGHFAIVDQDGSLTRGMIGGGCGASIVGMASHMRHSECQAVGDTKVRILPRILFFLFFNSLVDKPKCENSYTNAHARILVPAQTYVAHTRHQLAAHVQNHTRFNVSSFFLNNPKKGVKGVSHFLMSETQKEVLAYVHLSSIKLLFF